MNPFTSFNFAGLIKTLLPGFLLVGAMMLLLKACGVPVDDVYRNNKDLALIVVVIGGITAGLISNTVVFMGLNGFRAIHEKANPEFYNFEAWVKAQIVRTIPDLPKKHHSSLDAEALIVDKDRLPLLVYWMERYWFYMEFDLNMLVAMTALAVTSEAYLICCVSWKGEWWPAVVSVLIVVVTSFAAGLLFSAACRNFDRHKRKMASLQLAAVRDWREAEIARKAAAATGATGAGAPSA